MNPHNPDLTPRLPYHLRHVQLRPRTTFMRNCCIAVGAIIFLMILAAINIGIFVIVVAAICVIGTLLYFDDRTTTPWDD